MSLRLSGFATLRLDEVLGFERPSINAEPPRRKGAKFER
jgi:hypothetical protein